MKKIILNLIKKRYEYIYNLKTEQVLIYLKIFAFSLVIALIMMTLWKIFHKDEKAFVLISALAILISALLASYSVMLNIENTNENERLKKYSHKRSNILFLIQNLDDLLSVLNSYKDTDIGELKINEYNTLLRILEKKLDNIENKEIIECLSNDETNLLIFIRLSLYQSIGVIYNYTQAVVVEYPKRLNDSIKKLIQKSNLLISLLVKNNDIPIQKMEQN